ncbi:NFACT family protein [bacterium]|nr:NFACT family protein [bacterium]
MDCFVIKAIVEELRNWFCPGRITRINQTDAHTTWIQIKGKIDNWLVFSTSDRYPGLYISPTPPCRKPLKMPFCLTANKNLTGADIEEIEVDRMERIVRFIIVPRKAGHKLQRLILTAELISHNAGLFLLESEENRIIACSRAYKGGGRDVMPGETYRPLLSPSKIDPFEIDENKWREILLKRTLQEDLHGFMTRNLLGLSPVMAEEIVYRTGLESGVCATDSFTIERLWENTKEVFKEYGSPAVHPVVIIDKRTDMPVALSSFHLKSRDTEYLEQREFSTMNEAAGYFYMLFERIWKFRQQKAAIRSLIRKAQGRYQKRLICLNRDLDIFKKADRDKDYGDLLMAHLNLIHKGMTEITLPDLYQGGTITVPLDPAKGPIQNAQAFFKRYGKARRGLAMVQERKTEADGIVNRLNELASLLDAAENQEDLEKLNRILKPILVNDSRRITQISDSYSKDSSKKTDTRLSGIRLFKLDEGWDIMVGKTDKANDYLTMEMAKSEDVWMHVDNAPGSHVVLRNPKRLDDIPFDILKKTACLAAFFSRQRNEDKVSVCYTRKKFVRKPKGMKPGQVLIERQKVLTVNPSEAVPLFREKE